MHPHYIDLFSGAGGLSLGMNRAGWSPRFAIEKDRMSFETYSANFIDESRPYAAPHLWPEWLDQTPHNIIDILGNDNLVEKIKGLKDVDAVVGGPPCQGFSVAGKRLADDPRNQLAYHFCKFVRLVLPPVFLIENVEGITHRLTDSNGHSGAISTADAISKEMNQYGYQTAYKVINALDFGVPQDRRRAIIIGVHSSSGQDIMGFWETMRNQGRAIHSRHGSPQHSITVGEAISDLDSSIRLPCPDAPRFQTSPYEDASSEYQVAMRRGIPAGEIPDSHRYANHGPTVTERFKIIQKQSSAGRQTNGFLRSLGEYSTRKNKIHWLNPDKPSTTITSQPGDFLHPYEPRELTVREMARLQSFPDDFLIRGRYTINGPRRPFDTARCSQVGNAVAPLMAEGIGASIKKLLG